MSKSATTATLTVAPPAAGEEESHWVAFEPDELEALRQSLEEAHRRTGSASIVKLLKVLDEAPQERTAALMIATELRLLVAASEAAQTRLESVIERLLPDLTFPSDAAVLEARRNAQARTELLQEFGALTGEQIAEERSKAKNRHALAARWRKEGRIFGVEYRGQILYPAFQFAETGELRPVIREVLGVLPRERMTDWEVALWWTARNGWLGGRRPVDLLDAPGTADLVSAARHLGEPSAL